MTNPHTPDTAEPRRQSQATTERMVGDHPVGGRPCPTCDRTAPDPPPGDWTAGAVAAARDHRSPRRLVRLDGDHYAVDDGHGVFGTKPAPEPENDDTRRKPPGGYSSEPVFGTGSKNDIRQPAD